MNVRLLLRSLAFGFATSACLLIGTGFGSAQSPSPTNTFGNVAPGVTSVPSGSSGIVVEGLGGGACYYSASSVETSTVYWLDNYWPTWTEISPQAGCKTVAGYESEVDAIVYDVDIVALHRLDRTGSELWSTRSRPTASRQASSKR